MIIIIIHYIGSKRSALMNIKKENKKEDNLNWPYIPDHPYRILIIGGSGAGKTNALLNLINNQQDIHKIYLYAKDPYEDKYQYLINKRESVGLNILMILKHLLNIQMICMMFIKILITITPTKKIRYQ